MEKIAVKSTKAMFTVLVSVIVLLLIGIYFIVAYQSTDQTLVIIGYVLSIAGLLFLIVNIPSIFSPTVLIEKDDEDTMILHQLLKKDKTINIKDITEIKSVITLRRYLRPLSSGYYTYGTLIIKTNDKRFFVQNVEDLKEVEASLKEIVKL